MKKKTTVNRTHAEGKTTRPTPIPISKRTRSVLLLGGVVALVLLLWAAPSVPVIALGGFAFALVISFPVRALSHVMPRGLAILASFLSLVGLAVFAVAILVPILIEQLSSLINSAPDIVRSVNRYLLGWFELLAEQGFLPGSPEEFLSGLEEDLLSRVQDLAEQVLGGLVGLVRSAFSFAIIMLGVVLVAVYLLLDVRRFKAAYLWAIPSRYRRDGRDLWDAFAFSLSRYLAGLGLVVFIQGLLSGTALYFIGVPYALLLGAWVSVTAVIPYLGAWLGAIPAVVLALFVSPGTALLTAVVFLLIQQLEGNVLTPRIQGQALRVHPILVLLAVIAGGELAGLLGVIFAVPALAVLRVLFDFLRLRLRVRTD